MAGLNNLIENAQLLLRENPAAAMKLLVDGRASLGHVPDMYDMLLARAAIDAKEPSFALNHLEKIAETASPSFRLRRVSAEALLALNRISEAGEQLYLAVQAGLSEAMLPPYLALVLQEHRRLLGEETSALRASARYGVLDERQKLLFVYVPKNACTVLKATVIMNSPHRNDYLAAGTPIHEFVGKIADHNRLTQALEDPGIFRFTVLRDPASRILSAYLNKFVASPKGEPQGLTHSKANAVRLGQKIAGVKADPERGITFEEFVHYLAQAHDLEMDPHWIPQTRIVGTDLSGYDHVGRFENLSPTFDLLQSRFGYVPERESSVHLNGQLDHATKYSPACKMQAAYRATPEALRRLGKIYPTAENFLNDDLRAILTKRYAQDALLHQQI